ncbi:hypothetical protein AERO9AM_30436 [Aeromicrobium sp. 9AM]|nr:hypothetical protein AERO9AM_30436 [Aeromicrobium sp. 9AM]
MLMESLSTTPLPARAGTGMVTRGTVPELAPEEGPAVRS